MLLRDRVQHVERRIALLAQQLPRATSECARQHNRALVVAAFTATTNWLYKISSGRQ